MQRAVLTGLLLVSLFARLAAAQERFPGTEWAHVAPAQDGWSDAGLAAAKDWSQQQVHSTAAMIIHHGAVVAEWGDTAKRAELASIRKSLLSALIGQAVAQHKIDLDRTIGQLGIVNQVDRDQHLPQPALRDVSELVRLIRSAEPDRQ